MSKHHHQGKAEQINNKIHDMAQLQQNRMSYQTRETVKMDDIKMKTAIQHSSIQQRAYQIHSDKGGTALDNWLEAEQILKNEDGNYFHILNEASLDISKKQ